MENTCDEVFTFMVGHDRAKFLGEEDFHDPKYDGYVQSSIFADFANPPELEGTGLGDHCVYTMRIYPTRMMESAYMTQQPIIFCAIAVVIFLFTSLVFITYDCFVQRRQKKVSTIATKTHAIVSVSLFD